MNLGELAILKIKADAYAALYKERIEQLKADLEAKKETRVHDTENQLAVKLVNTSQRDFNVQGVREALGKAAEACISEKIDTKKFDSLTKIKGKYTITEEAQAKCFCIIPKTSVNWDGLGVFKAKLTAELIGDKNARRTTTTNETDGSATE